MSEVMTAKEILKNLYKDFPMEKTLENIGEWRRSPLTTEQKSTVQRIIRELNLTDKFSNPENLNISQAVTLTELKESKDKCAACVIPPFESCEKLEFVFDVADDGSLQSWGVEKSACAKRAKFFKAQRLLDKAGVPKVFKNITAGADFKITPGNRKAALLAERCIDDDKGLYIYGKVRVGKTMLCCVIANERARQGKDTLFITVPDMLDELKDFSNPERRREKLELFQTCDCLIIDDLGAEYQTAWTAAELFRILDARIKLGKQTIINSNFHLKELEVHMIGYNAKRVCGRISELCTQVYIDRF